MTDPFEKYRNPRIEILSEKKLIGKNLEMSIVKNRTAQLWGSFMPKVKEITNCLTNDKISLQVYKSSYFDDFNPNNKFVKWATVEVANFDFIPDGMGNLTLKGGLYAVFEHKGSSKDSSVFQYIFTEWLPNSDYILDHRPHFEVLGEKYKNNDPESEEEIWIPIAPKNKKPH